MRLPMLALETAVAAGAVAAGAVAAQNAKPLGKRLELRTRIKTNPAAYRLKAQLAEPGDSTIDPTVA